jgi:esterase/lipase superfamily enzyme
MAYKEEYFKWHSPNLGTDFEMSVYGHGGQPVVIFPTTMGRYFESKDFNLIESASWFLEQGKVQILIK